MSIRTILRQVIGLDHAEDVRATAKEAMREISHRSRNEATVAVAAARATEKATGHTIEELKGALREQQNALRNAEVNFLRRIRGEE